jgi:hypothetical protein
MVVADSNSTALRTLVRTVAERLAMDGLEASDMSRAGALELDQTLNTSHGDGSASFERIERLEGPIEAKPVIRHSGHSPVRYFLDGAQRTLPVWRIGAVPIVASLTAAAILDRKASENFELLPESLVVRVRWIVPRRSEHPSLARIVELLDAMGETVVDPLESAFGDDDEAYRAALGNYTVLLEMSHAAASNQRAQIEERLLQYWQEDVYPADRESWIVVDGRVRGNVRNAIGLVKNAQIQHVTGEEALALYDLPVAHRTSAYVLVEKAEQQETDRAMWFLRMQNATGTDARHGLIRLETRANVADLDLINPISSWILAERAPRASEDPRWPVLLYPIHLLERMLKRRIAAITAGWPA